MRTPIRIVTANDLPEHDERPLYAEINKCSSHSADTNDPPTWELIVSVKNDVGDEILELVINCNRIEPQIYREDYT